jgi:aminopeptidase N
MPFEVNGFPILFWRDKFMQYKQHSHMKLSISLAFLLFAFASFSQSYTRQDSLRGSITLEREWWNLKSYDLSVTTNIEEKSISGSNVIRYEVLQPGQSLQVDLQEPLIIDKVEQNGKELEVLHEGNAHFVQLEAEQTPGAMNEIKVYYHGVPRQAIQAPWDGGFSWAEDSNGLPFVATSNQGLGASVWWPCKDHMYDENEDGMIMRYTVPENLVAVGNGRLVDTKRNRKNKTKTYTWKVVNPINNYGVNLNIGDYVSFSDEYEGEKGELDMIYYVLRESLDKAKEQFKDAIRTMEAFEYWFGPYPFYEDSYKLVEVPYLGMEHQSSVTYGNNYANGYLGRDLSGTGWGLKWDFIIVHESGHEWFANNITYADIADMWIHESFTNYSESLFTEYHYGKEAGAEYVRGLRMSITNRGAMIGDYGVNDGGEDLYMKGANLLHTIRQLVGDDEKWRSMLRGLNEEFYHQVVTTDQIESYIISFTGLDLENVFDQYLRDIRIPVLEYVMKDGSLLVRWTNCLEAFDMPVNILVGDKEQKIYPSTIWERMNVPVDFEDVKVDPDYYIYADNLTN